MSKVQIIEGPCDNCKLSIDDTIEMFAASKEGLMRIKKKLHWKLVHGVLYFDERELVRIDPYALKHLARFTQHIMKSNKI